MDKFISFFGKFTAASEKNISSFKFEYLTTLGIAALVIFLGRFLVSNSKHLRKYAIPAPVVSGLIFSIIIAILKSYNFAAISFDTKIMKDLSQNIFFLCVGFGFSYKILTRASNKLIFNIAFGACLLITLQDILGVYVGKLIGLHPLLALQCSSSAMSGGVGTASAFGPTFIKMGAPASATTIGVAAGTMGNIMGSLIGGPVAAYLISKHKLKSDPNDKPEELLNNVVLKLDNNRMIVAFSMILLIAAMGIPIWALIKFIPFIEMPKFIGCLFAGVIARNILDFFKKDNYVPEINAIEHMFLELYLALVLMSIDITKIIPFIDKMGIILLAQAILIILFTVFISYNIFGRNYDAAVMASGNCGWGCGSGPNAVANEKAVMNEYGWSTIAWVLYPSFAVIIDDIYNPIFLSIFGSFFAS